MGNRDRPKGDGKKPKKNDAHARKPLAGAALAQPTPIPEIVRKKKRSEPAPEE